MSSLDELVNCGLLDKDFLDIQNDGLSVINEDNVNDDNVTQVPTLTYNDKTFTHTPSSKRNPYITNDGEETFSHTPRLDRKPYVSDIDDVVDTSDEEEEEVGSDKYKYYKNVKYHWLYAGRRGPGWWHYSDKANERLERKYSSGKDRTKLKIEGNQLIIDFNDMTQRSGSSSRNILRITTLKDIFLRGIKGDYITKEELYLT